MSEVISEPRSHIGRSATALGLITVIGPAGIDMYLPFLPHMATELAVDYGAMQLTLTVFLVAMGAGQLLFGPGIDALGRRRPLLIALMVFTLSAVLAAFANTLSVLIIARVLQGLAAALAIVTAMSSVRDIAEGVRAAQIFAALMTVQGLGPVMAPAFGGLIGDAFGWRAIFLVLAGLGALVLVNSAVMLPETLPHARRSRFSLGTILRTYATILADRRFLLPGLALAAVFVFLFSYIGGASYAYQTEYGVSPGDFGLIFGATGVAVLLGALASARLVTRYRAETLGLRAAILILLGAGIAFASAHLGIGLAGVIAGMFLALGGLGIAEAVLMSIALSTRSTALGASAALLGAGPLLMGAAATPFAAALSQHSAAAWLGLLVLAALAALGLTVASVWEVRKSGQTIELRH